jgi:hypothetical protein
LEDSRIGGGNKQMKKNKIPWWAGLLPDPRKKRTITADDLHGCILATRNPKGQLVDLAGKPITGNPTIIKLVLVKK